MIVRNHEMKRMKMKMMKMDISCELANLGWPRLKPRIGFSFRDVRRCLLLLTWVSLRCLSFRAKVLQGVPACLIAS